MQSFVARQNIEHFRRLIAEASDAKARQALADLLRAEIEKLPQELRDAERRARDALIRAANGPAAADRSA